MLCYLQQVESRIADAEACVTRSQQSLVAWLTQELTRAKATLARKTTRLIEQQRLNHRLRARIRERAYAEHDLQLQYIGADPAFDGLRNDPRFADLLRRVGLS